MAGNLCITLTQSSPFSPKLYSSKPLLQKSHRISIAPLTPFLKFQDSAPSQCSTRGFTTICFSSPRNGSDYKGGGPDWPILRRWDVPWNWQTVSLSSLACGLRCNFVTWLSFQICCSLQKWRLVRVGSFRSSAFLKDPTSFLEIPSNIGLIETASIPYVGLDVEALSLDEKAEILFADQAITTAVVLIVLYTLTKSSQPLPDDIYRYDLKEPFNLQRGWLLWAGIGLAGAIGAIALTGVAMSAFNGEPPQRETDALARLLPLIGSSSISTASLLGITGVLAPILEETVFRGFFMVSLTKWVPTPLAAVISGSVFALAHLTPGQFPQLFVLGTALGLSYAQTRNLLTPITIHALWNSGVILLLTFLQLQGYDIREIIQGT